ncbi:MAG: radical SAM protein [Clostridia bacterium]|nr:radical SAM protein [Clostridia bacterium]
MKKMGFCHSGPTAVITRAAPHLWEEPPISGTNGSGTVFFAGCNLRCVFCQNVAISRDGTKGRAVTAEELRTIFLRLKDEGVHNINLVTPTHFAHVIGEALNEPIGLPVVYNSGGYEQVETLRSLEGKIQIYLPDMKYMDEGIAAQYSAAPDYPQVAKEAILEMFRQVGPCRLDEDGILQQGIIIRHMILPGHTKNTLAVIDWVANTFKKGEVLFSLMSQYTPTEEVANHKNLGRKITRREYKKCRDAMLDAGIEDGFVQDLTAATDGYVPDFDGTGTLL